MIEFEGDHISLDIRSKDMGKKEWSITPLSAPVVSEVAYLLNTYSAFLIPFWLILANRALVDLP